MRFTWDAAKNRANKKKHGVSFEEASELFRSATDYLEIFDEDHADLEDRFIAIGPIARGLVLVVWTERDEDTIRNHQRPLATRREQNLYREFAEET